MVDPAPIPPDKFWNLTATAWTAISSLIATASVIALIVFNWRFLRSAHEQGEAAKEQAAVAKTSLETLQKQIFDDQQLERHAALVILRETSTQIEFWRGHSKMETRPETERVYLLPDDWNVLASYVSRRIPGLVGKTRVAAWDLREAELLLNRVLHTPLNIRNGNNSTQIIMDSLIQRLGQIKVTFDLLENEFNSSGPPAPPPAK
jgi:hypothetical protein